MSWFRPFRDWSSRGPSASTAQRTPRAFEHTTVEELESRLCLGGLTSPPIGESLGGGSNVAAEVGAIDPSSSAFDLDTTSTIEPVSTAGTDSYGTSGPGNSNPTAPPAPASPLDTDVFADTQQIEGEHSGQAFITGPAVEDSQSTATGGQVTPLRDTAGGEAATPAESAGAAGAAAQNDQMVTGDAPWWLIAEENVVVRYDFRDENGHYNLISEEEQAVAVEALEAWSLASEGHVVFVRDTVASADEIVNIGVGDLAAHGGGSVEGGVLGLGGGRLELEEDGSVLVTGGIWLDGMETWDVEIGNGDPEGTVDFFTVLAHETGHVLGLDDAYSGDPRNMMHGVYNGERSVDGIELAILNGGYYTQPLSANLLSDELVLRPMVSTAQPQLQTAEVNQLLDRASAATASRDAIIAVVDRGGRILGVRVEDGVSANVTGNTNNLVFAIDGALAKARAAAFFSSDATPLTSRLVQFIAQSTILEREVNANPNVGLTPTAAGTVVAVDGNSNITNVPFRTQAEVLNSTVYGPGFVAAVGLGGHFPPGVPFTPPVDLFAVEHKDRDSRINPGNDGIKGTADDIFVPNRLNAGVRATANAQNVVAAGVTTDPNQLIEAPESYGFESGLLPFAQSRGLGTLPGGAPIFRDTNGDLTGDTLIGGIGVFFPGEDGTAVFEQGFQAGIGQTQEQRQNAAKALEAEYIAYAAIGGATQAQTKFEVNGARIGNIAGTPPVANLDLLFGRIDLVGITLPIVGPIAGREGVERTIALGNRLGEGTVNGANQVLTGGAFLKAGRSLPSGFLVAAQDGVSANGEAPITAAEVNAIIQAGIAGSDRTRSAIRVPNSSGSRMIFVVSDLNGNIVGFFRQEDSLFDAFDVTPAKARNAAYYADPNGFQAVDGVPGIPPGTAFSGRTFRFLAEPRFPAGIDGTQPPVFSSLNQPSINETNGENIGAPAPASAFDAQLTPGGTVLGYDSFFANQNFHDPNNPENQNGVIFFQGNTPIYRDGVLIGGLGVSGDGVDQDDVVTFLAAQGFLPPPGSGRADDFLVNNVRLPYIKSLRNPTGNVFPFG